LAQTFFLFSPIGYAEQGNKIDKSAFLSYALQAVEDSKTSCNPNDERSIAMDTQVPLISTCTTGPLGVVHLPRLWQKLRLSAKGLLAEGYRAGEGGFDEMLLEALGISSAAAIAFVQETQPTYLAFEAWVEENAGSLTAAAIEQINESILSIQKPEPWRSEMLDLLGLPKDDKGWLATELNDLEDWRDFHLALLEA
jgi:hypothetical protein